MEDFCSDTPKNSQLFDIEYRFKSSLKCSLKVGTFVYLLYSEKSNAILSFQVVSVLLNIL